MATITNLKSLQSTCLDAIVKSYNEREESVEELGSILPEELFSQLNIISASVYIYIQNLYILVTDY